MLPPKLDLWPCPQKVKLLGGTIPVPRSFSIALRDKTPWLMPAVSEYINLH